MKQKLLSATQVEALLRRDVIELIVFHVVTFNDCCCELEFVY